jgi:serine/threonine protein kinase/tetratricopeptide (TPR) repeat protein
VSFVFTGTERFQILRQLGAGGMGVVYEALDRETRTRVALKTLRILNGDTLLRFKTEFRSLQGLQHENLVALRELLEDRGHWFFTMELVEGTDFLSYVGRNRYEDLHSEATTLAQGETSRRPTADSDTRLSDELEVPRATYGIDEARLRAALGQLVCGLRVLHEAGKVHRDVKPSNCLITPQGRVVVLDFGLITDLTSSNAWNLETDLVGTVPYMAPEQAAAKPARPAADMYSVGVVLYEALTGLLPFAGPPGLVVQLKQTETPVAPRRLLSEVPPDLDALCMDLLQIDPDARPTTDMVLTRLGFLELRPRRISTSSGPQVTAEGATAFIGRQTELSLLHAAFADSRDHAVAVLLSGESGVGKSSLLARFTTQLAAAGIAGPSGAGGRSGAGEPSPVVLGGRCHEREAVPYKAFDGIVDQLSAYLGHLSFVEVGALLPRQSSLLLQAFPVLERVSAIASAPRAGEARDPQELRSRTFGAVRSLFARLARHRPLILIMEDIQWSDADSRALLQELLRPPDAPRLLLVTTVRTPVGSKNALAALPHLASVSPLLPLPGADVRHIELPRLSRDESRALAERLMPPGARWSDEALDAIAIECEGHPLFLDELVRHLDTGGHYDAASFQLEVALGARIEELDRGYQRLLRVVCAAGRPIEQSVAAAVAGLQSQDMPLMVRALEVAKLVRTGGPRASDAIEPYHDLVRAAVLVHVDEDTLRGYHVAIAEALEDAKAPAEALSFHWREAGQLERAARYAMSAAMQAARTLAFDRAARLYRMAIETGCLSEDIVRKLYIGLGDALVNAGRGDEAARAYLEAAARSTDAKAIELKRRAVEHRLRSGHIQDALVTLHEILDVFDLKLPGSKSSAMLMLLAQRSLLAVRGTRFHERPEAEVPRDELMKIDVCWTVAVGMILANPIIGSGFIARNLRLSLAAGEPYRLSRALSLHSMTMAALDPGNATRAGELREIAVDLAHKSGNPHAIALSIMAEGWALFWRGHWRRALEVLERAEVMFRTECSNLEGSPTSRLLILWCLFYLGDLSEMSRRLPDLLGQAHERGDLQAAVNMGTGVSHLDALAQDTPERGRAAVAEHIAMWKSDYFYLQHWNAFVAQTEIDLYRGDRLAAHARMTAGWPQISSSVPFRNQKLRQDAHFLLARTSLAAAEITPMHERAPELRRVEKAAQQIEREGMPWSAPLALLARAGVAHLRGDVAGAIQILAAADAAFEHADMKLHAEITRYRRGLLAGDKEGRKLAATVRKALIRRGVRRPEAMAACLAPGLESA